MVMELPFMDSPRYTVIIPMFRFRADEPVLVSLRKRLPRRAGCKFSWLRRPSARQRNAALGKARGDVLVFLDNDCSIEVPTTGKNWRRRWPGLKWESWAGRPYCVRRPPHGRRFFRRC